MVAARTVQPNELDVACLPNAAGQLVKEPAVSPTPLEDREAKLTRDVPKLLEVMNRTSDEVNALERQCGGAQERYKKLLEQWSRLYEDLRAEHGSAIDRVKPYFDAEQALNAASQRVQNVVREFSATASQYTQAKKELRSIESGMDYGAHKVALETDQQDSLSRATVRVLKCQQERDRREQDYEKALNEYREAHKTLEEWRTQIGDALIKRTLPCFRQLQQHQITLAHEQNRVNHFTERAKAAKKAYNTSMRELDRINVAVHGARRDHAAEVAQLQAAQAAAEDAARDKSPETEVPEACPERSPEASAMEALGDEPTKCLPVVRGHQEAAADDDDDCSTFS